MVTFDGYVRAAITVEQISSGINTCVILIKKKIIIEYNKSKN